MDPQNDKSDVYKKRSFISPQKAQTSIRSFTNSNKQAQKRLNNNASPKKLLPDIVKPFEGLLPESPPNLKKTNPASPLSRSFLANTNPSQKAAKVILKPNSENYYDAISTAEEELDEGTQHDEETAEIEIVSEKADKATVRTMQEKIAFARQVLSDKSLLAELKLDDEDKEIFIQHFSSTERPKQQNSLNQETKETSENSQPKQGNLGSPIETRKIEEDKEEEDVLMDDATPPSLTSTDQSNASTRVSFAKDVNEPPQRKSVLRT
jgi:hypothetical protein